MAFSIWLFIIMDTVHIMHANILTINKFSVKCPLKVYTMRAETWLISIVIIGFYVLDVLIANPRSYQADTTTEHKFPDSTP